MGINFDSTASQFPKLRTLKLIPRYTYPLQLSSIHISHNKITKLYIGKFVLSRTSNVLHLTCPNLRTLTFDGICVFTINVQQHSSGRVPIQRYLHRFFHDQQYGLRSLQNLRSLFVTGRTIRTNSQVVDVYNFQDLVKLKHSFLVGDTQQDTFITISEMSNILQDCPKLDFRTCFTPTTCGYVSVGLHAIQPRVVETLVDADGERFR